VIDEGPATALASIGRFVAAARASRHVDSAAGGPRVEPPQPMLVKP
jgi:hypothetical protein